MWLTAAGILGGTMMLPLKLSPATVNGFNYALSFALAVGALTIAGLAVLYASGRRFAWHPRTVSLPAVVNVSERMSICACVHVCVCVCV